jgi:glutamine synthetase
MNAMSWAPTTLAWGYDNRTCGFDVEPFRHALHAAIARAGCPGTR